MKNCELVTTEAELRAAVTAGGEVYVDTGTSITLTSPVDVTVPVRIIGGTYSVPSGVGFHVTSSNVEFNRVRMGGGWSYAGGHDPGQKLIYVQGTATSKLENISIHDSFFSGSRADNVWLEWVKDSYVSDNIIKRYLYSGVMLISCDGVVVNGNNIWDSPLVGQLNCYGIAATDLDNTEAARSRNCLITGNRVHLVDWEGIDTHGGDGITVTGNTVTACPRGIALVTGNSTRVASPTRCVVSGNNVDGAGSRQTVREGIWLGGIANVPADGVVTGNIVTNFDKAFSTPYVDRGKTFVGGNNVPFVDWTLIDMDEFTAHGTWPPEFMIDGNTVTVRGAGYPKTGTSKIYGTIPNVFAAPSELSMVGAVKGSDPNGSVGMFAVHPDRRVQLYYKNGTDTPAFFLSGSYEAV